MMSRTTTLLLAITAATIKFTMTAQSMMLLRSVSKPQELVKTME